MLNPYHNATLLGQATKAPERYAPHILQPIPRALARVQLPAIEGMTQGFDWWQVFECSWLDLTGRPHVAVLRLDIPAQSPALIESKSLKLYFNSLNFHHFASHEDFIDQIQHDLSNATGAWVGIHLYDVHELNASAPLGQCIDHYPLPALSSTDYAAPNATILKHVPQGVCVEQQLYTDLLRTNCPVTGQPDWGTVMVRYKGLQIDPSGLLAYIISYRRHTGFHEACTEQIFADIWQQLQPERLMVYAAYTRRGGLDINPCRVSHLDWLPEPIRLLRQ